MELTIDRGSPGTVKSVRSLLREVPQLQMLLLAVLMVAGALTDGIGIVLLVPLLTMIDDGGTFPQMTGLLRSIGLELDIAVVLALFVGLVLLRAILMSSLGQLRLRMQHELVDRLRQRCYSRLVHAEWRWLSGQRAADHNAILTTTIATVGTGFDQAIGMLASSIAIATLAAAALYLSWQTALLAFGACAIGLLALTGIRGRAQSAGREINRANRDLHRHVEQGLPSIRLAKLFDNEAVLTAGFASAINAVRDEKLGYSRDSNLAQTLIQVGGAFLLAIIAYAGIAVWKLSLPVVIPLLLVFVRMVPMLGVIQNGWSLWLHARPALHEVHQLIERAGEHGEPQAAHSVHVALQHGIELSEVSIRYAGRDRPALDGVSLTIPANATTAVFGQSGAGKSTLADLLMGLLEPDDGSIRIDGATLDSAMRRQWRKMVAYVDQTPFLLHASIRANLRWGKAEASDAELGAALKLASAEFVLALPDGLDTIVGDSGVRLSGGERQRIALARALLRRPFLLILDEATSALDPENEAAISRAIAGLRGKITVLLIGHQASIRSDSDQVIELGNGRVMSDSRIAPPA